MTVDTDEDRAAIAAIIALQEAAWVRGDAAGFAVGVTDDVIFTNIVGMFSVGRAPFIGQHAHIFGSFYRGTTMKQEIVHIAFIRPDVAVVDTLTEVTGITMAPPGLPFEGGTVRSRLEQVMTRDDGQWRVAAFHNVAVNAAALAAAGPRPL